ncbi:MAG: DNA polymerase III subunit beta [Chloroflexi bacterium]|nr:DNA polymerase III subunit beta [Chloroflexota bacterium]MBM3172109.1 DNA polymerase III subunit beta [Chloroflexota bacterium]MBM3175001.1 DNA polymerase III subunit beta [Chloroflexota bacterium]MBM4449373.1 DNA polymerase III subunit beta [Chloroflexota bacterium]
MKLSCLQENLNKGLSIVGRAVATRTTLPITQNVLIQTDESRLKLAATNLEMAVSCWIGAKIEEEGAITVPARLLTEFVNLLPNDQINITLTKNTLKLKCARFETKINGLDAQDFPPIPKVGDGATTKIEAEALRTGIGQVAFAAATEESRPVLTGVQFEFEKDKLTMAAADGFRLGVHNTTLLSPVSSKVAIIIPARALNELSRFLADQEEPVEVTVNQQKSQVLFHLKNIEMVSQLIQGTFPNYSQLIPQSYQSRAVIDVAEFLQAIKMASIFARDGSGIVRVEMLPGAEPTPGKIKISARAEEIGENESEIDALIDGEAAKIAFNAKYVSDVLGVIHQKQVALETTTSSSPGVIRPMGVDNYVHVVMPMFVQW